jgi:hypothetical protein
VSDAITLEEWARRLESRSGPALGALLRRELAAEALRIESGAKSNATTRPRVRSGRLRASITGAVRATPDGAEVSVRAGHGATVTYARAQEEGATIRPRGRYLAIPLPSARTAAGVTRGRYTRPGGLRQVPGLFVVRGRSGRLLLCERKPGGGIRPLFVLHPGPIRIPATWYLRRAVEDGARRLRALLPDVLEFTCGIGSSP